VIVELAVIVLDDYVSWIVSAARELEFPDWCVDRIVQAGASKEALTER